MSCVNYRQTHNSHRIEKQQTMTDNKTQETTWRIGPRILPPPAGASDVQRDAIASTPAPYPAVMLIEPQSETIDWARGVVPRPAGAGEVEWSIEGKRLLFCCNAPKWVRWQVAPKGRLARKELVIVDDPGSAGPGGAARSS